MLCSQSGELAVQTCRTGIARAGVLEVDFFDIGRGPHDAFELPAVAEAERVPQFVHHLLLQADEHDSVVAGQTIELIRKPVRGHNRSGTAQLRFPENEGQDGDEQIRIHDRDPLVVRLARPLQYLGEEMSGVSLPPRGVLCGPQIEFRAAQLDWNREDLLEPA